MIIGEMEAHSVISAADGGAKHANLVLGVQANITFSAWSREHRGICGDNYILVMITPLVPYWYDVGKGLWGWCS